MGEGKKKDINIFKILTIFLFIVILGLIGYIVFNNNNNSVNNKDNDSKMLDLSKFGEFKNYDGSYALINEITLTSKDNNSYDITMDMEGKVYVGYFASKKEITNIKNGIDIVGYDTDIENNEESKCYILTDGGEVYVYSIDNIKNNNYKATLVKVDGKVNKIFKYLYASDEDSISVSGVIAVLDNGETYKLG